MLSQSALTWATVMSVLLLQTWKQIALWELGLEISIESVSVELSEISLKN